MKKRLKINFYGQASPVLYPPLRGAPLGVKLNVMESGLTTYPQGPEALCERGRPYGYVDNPHQPLSGDELNFLQKLVLTYEPTILGWTHCRAEHSNRDNFHRLACGF